MDDDMEDGFDDNDERDEDSDDYGDENEYVYLPGICICKTTEQKQGNA